MKCKHCDFENLDQATYCSGCGKPLNESNDVVTQSKNFETKNRRILISVMSILGIGLAMIIAWMILRPNQLELAKEAYQSDDLTAYENVESKLSKEQKTEFDAYLIEEAQSIFDAFKSDGLFYKEAVRRLEKIKLYVIQTDEVNTIMTQLESLNSSRQAYNEGKSWIEAKEWDNAKASFEAVLPLDPNYDFALRYLESIQRWQLQEIGAKALDYLEQEDYEKAVNEIMKGLEIDPTNETLLNIKQTIQDALNTPPVIEEAPQEQPKGLGETIKDGLQAIRDGIKSFFDGSWLEN